jgi:hypothetical protein
MRELAIIGAGMKVDVFNNWKYKRSLSNGLWLSWGRMFPWPNRRFIQLGLFGFIFMVQWGEMT